MTWEIPLERRITVVSGDSGIGKTAMTNLLVNSSGRNVTVKFPMKIYVATRDYWELTVSSAKK
jgi:guanylate kinase